MDRAPSRSFATRVVLAYVGAAVALMFLIGSASTFFTFGLYARTSNEVIARVTRGIERRVANYRTQHVPLTRLAPLLTADLERPRIRIAVFDENRKLLSESAPPREAIGLVAPTP